MTTIGASVIFAVDFHDVFMCKASEFPANLWYMRSEQESISCLVADSAIGILVIVAKSGIIHIVSLLDGRQLGQLDFAGQKIDTVLVTETWHLVVVACGLEVHVVTIRGKQLKSGVLFKKMTIATAFHVVNRSDFVAFVDTDNQLRVIEVWYPDKPQTLGRVRTPVVALEYLNDDQSILLIEYDGTLSKVTFPLVAPP
jgi:hypothetical protein